MARVLIVEDDETMAEMVAYNLRRQKFEVNIASDGEAGLAQARKGQFACLILDLMLPNISGLQIAKEIRTQQPEVAILMLTARDEEPMKLRGFQAGVDDYLTKPFGMEELVARVKALVRRSRLDAVRNTAPDELHFGDLRIKPRDFLCWVNGTEVTLRPKELSLIATLASEPGRLFSRIELAEQVWGYSYLGDTRTIDTHVKNLRRKVESRSGFTYIETVRGVGYRFRIKPKELSDE